MALISQYNTFDSIYNLLSERMPLGLVDGGEGGWAPDEDKTKWIGQYGLSPEATKHIITHIAKQIQSGSLTLSADVEELGQSAYKEKGPVAAFLRGVIEEFVAADRDNNSQMYDGVNKTNVGYSARRLANAMVNPDHPMVQHVSGKLEVDPQQIGAVVQAATNGEDEESAEEPAEEPTEEQAVYNPSKVYVVARELRMGEEGLSDEAKKVVERMLSEGEEEVGKKMEQRISNWVKNSRKVMQELLTAGILAEAEIEPEVGDTDAGFNPDDPESGGHKALDRETSADYHARVQSAHADLMRDIMGGRTPDRGSGF